MCTQCVQVSVPFPHSCSYCVQSVRDVSRHAETPHFIQLTGVLCSISARMHYSQCATFRCPRVGCPGATKEAEGFVRLHSVGKKEAELTRQKPCCPHCGEITVEDVTCRSLSGTCMWKGRGRHALSCSGDIDTYTYMHVYVPLCVMPLPFLNSEKTVVRLVPVQALNMATVQLYGDGGMRHQPFSVVLRGKHHGSYLGVKGVNGLFLGVTVY